MAAQESVRTRGPMRLTGVGVSPGVAIGPVHLLIQDPVHVPVREIAAAEIDAEIGRFERALILTRRQIRDLQKDIEARTTAGDASILDAHLMVLDDRAFLEDVILEIRSRQLNAEAVVRSSSERYAAVLGSVKDDYLRERVADIRDVARRLLRNLSGATDAVAPVGRCILVAEDLAPSATAALSRETVLGIATDLGSATAHTAVMARAMEIPAIVGLHDITTRVKSGDRVVMDGNRGILIVNPTDSDLEEYGRLAETRRMVTLGLVGLQGKPAETGDGRRVVLAANAEGPEEIDSVLAHGAEGVGLFRTEYLYLSRGAELGEEEQYRIYRDVAEKVAPSAVIIRTLDLGGDKFLEDPSRRRESNPFLGCRSIRLSLQHPEHFKRQLRAVLRASAARGNVKLMYPMISGVSEVRQANALLEECRGELRAAGQAFDPAMEVGVMVEIPSAALTAGALAAEVDFLSIGTNDLIQYTLAVDRVNDRVAYLYEPAHPAVLQLIRMTVEAGHAAGAWVGLCGEMGADPLFAPLLVGMGIDEISVAPSAVPAVKDVIRALQFSRARDLAERALRCSEAADVRALCREVIREVAPELLELM
jgi:phosphotransferase system enzyme I (PtsI)